MKENLLLLKELLELWKLKSTNTWLQDQKKVHIYQLDDIVDECNNTYHKTIKMNPANFKSGNYIKCNINYNDKDPKF